MITPLYVVVATAKVQIFKQITTDDDDFLSKAELLLLPQRYKFSSKSQLQLAVDGVDEVVVATAKVQIFKQITTDFVICCRMKVLLLLPQRYKFSSKSQPERTVTFSAVVVVATAKVQIFKQITTCSLTSSIPARCCCYRKGTNFQANHNCSPGSYNMPPVVVATAKVQIFKQITT